MWMHALEHKRKHANFFASSADHSQSWDCVQQFCSIGQQFSFVSSRAIDSNSLQILQRRAESDRSRNVRRTRLEFVRQFVIGRLLESDGTDHVATCLVRRHFIEQILASI